MKFKSLMHRRLAICTAIAIPAAMIAAPVMATHSWGGYHWKRTTNAELAIPVGDNVNATWQSAFDTAVADWNVSNVIQSPVVAGTLNPKTCKAVAGTIRFATPATAARAGSVLPAYRFQAGIFRRAQPN